MAPRVKLSVGQSGKDVAKEARHKKKPDISLATNRAIAKLLRELAANASNVGQDQYRSMAYRRAATTLSNHPTPIASGEEARKLYGIGKSIGAKIDEYLQSGKIQAVEKIRASKNNRAINELASVLGIGPKKAKKFAERGINTLDDLKKHKEELTNAQKIGLKYFNDFKQKVPRGEIAKLEKRIKKALKSLDKKYTMTICGSYRRGASESGDVDILITHEDHLSSGRKKKRADSKQCGDYLLAIVDTLKEEKIITDTISLGKTRFSGVCVAGKEKMHHRIDLRLLYGEQYHCGVLYFTGSDNFNRSMRQHAKDQGFKLSEYSLTRSSDGSAVEIDSERAIFRTIGLAYLQPSARNI